MLQVRVGQLKNRLVRLLRRVKAGESVIVYDGDRAIAKIEPFPDHVRRAVEKYQATDPHLASLIARGVVRPPQNLDGDWSFLKEPPPKAKASVLEALLDERREGR